MIFLFHTQAKALARQGKIKERQPHECNERTRILRITFERLYDGALLLARGGSLSIGHPITANMEEVAIFSHFTKQFEMFT